MSRIAIGLTFLAVLLAPGASGQALDAKTFQEKRRTLTGQWAGAATIAEKQAILAQLKALQLAESKAGVASPKKDEAEALIEKHTSLANLDEDALGKELAKLLPGDGPLVSEVFAQLGGGDRDDVAEALLSALSDDELRVLAADPARKAILENLIREMNSSVGVSTDEEVQIERATKATSSSHGRIMNAHVVSKTVQDALTAAGATIQKIEDGSGSYVFDEYSVVIDKMPPGTTAEQFLEELAKAPNATVNDSGFDAVNVFKPRRKSGDPQPGDIYDIDILGPDDGSVVLASQSFTADASRFTFVTITTPETGTHPEFGNREFGYFRNTDGSYTFYTRGVSRPANVGARVGGAGPQAVSWTRMMKGISNAVATRGGTPRPDSFKVVKGSYL